jgi:CRISPR-associated protein Csd1
VTILARLVDLHERLTIAGALEAPGYAKIKITYVVVLDPDGTLVEVEVTQTQVQRGKKSYAVPREFSAPAAVDRTVKIVPNLLWDTAEYVLGLGKDPAKQDPKTPLRHAAFKAAVTRIAEALPDDEGMAALKAFLDTHDPAAFAASEEGAKIEDRKLNVSFRLEGEHRLIAERPAVIRYLQASEADEDGVIKGQCLVTGTFGPIARLHPPIKGVAGAQTSGARLISFNKSAFESYGLTQGFVAPVGQAVAEAAGTALNWLLRSDSQHRLRLGETATTVVWTTGDTVVETLAASLFGGEDTSQEAELERLRMVQLLRDTLTAATRGTAPEAREDARFCLLTLAPNASRLAVAGWQEQPLTKVAEAILQWFADLEIVRPKVASTYPAILTLLRALAPMGELDRVPARLGQALFDAALSGHRLPAEVLTRALDRLRSDRVDPKAPYDALRRTRYDACRLSLVKAWLIRNHQWSAPVALDPHNPDAAYRLGRMFSLLEQGQAAAVKSANSSLGDQYFASASATPGRILPVLIAKFRKAHKRRIEGTLGHWIDARIADVLQGVEEMPTTLTLPEQGRFALGYYHQRAWRAPKPQDGAVDPTPDSAAAHLDTPAAPEMAAAQD